MFKEKYMGRLPCFTCANTNCGKLPLNGDCPDYEPATWRKYIMDTPDLSKRYVGGLKSPTRRYEHDRPQKG